LRVLTSEQMKAVEQYTAKFGLSYQRMMENAGAACARNIRNILDRDNIKGRKIIVVCGKGNNGGDGFVIARKFAENGYNVCILLASGYPGSAESTYMYKLALDLSIPTIWMDADKSKALKTIQNADIIVDAVFGFSFYGTLSDEMKYLFREMNEAKGVRFSVDLPSGVYCDSGYYAKGCFMADYTIAISSLKPAHIIHPACDYCGDIVVASIGIPEESYTIVQQLREEWEVKEIQDLEARKAVFTKEQYQELYNSKVSYLNNHDILSELLNTNECEEVPGFRCVQVETSDGKLVSLYAAFIKGENRLGFFFVFNDQMFFYTCKDYTVKDFMYYIVLDRINSMVRKGANTLGEIVYYDISSDKENSSFMSELALKDKMTQRFFADLNYSNYVQVSYDPYMLLDETFANHYIMSYAKKYNDTYILGTGNPQAPYYNDIQIAWYDSDLWYLSVYPEIVLGEKVGTSVELLPFARIEEIVRSYVDSLEFDTANGSVLTQIESIRLEYITLFDETSEQGIIVPAWNFYDSQKNIGPNNERTYTENRHWLSVNAIDGSIIE